MVLMLMLLLLDRVVRLVKELERLASYWVSGSTRSQWRLDAGRLSNGCLGRYEHLGGRGCVCLAWDVILGKGSHSGNRKRCLLMWVEPCWGLYYHRRTHLRHGEKGVFDHLNLSTHAPPKL